MLCFCVTEIRKNAKLLSSNYVSSYVSDLKDELLFAFEQDESFWHWLNSLGVVTYDFDWGANDRD